MLFPVFFAPFPGEGIGCLLCKQPPHELLMQFIRDLHATHERSIPVKEILQASIIFVLFHNRSLHFRIFEACIGPHI